MEHLPRLHCKLPKLSLETPWDSKTTNVLSDAWKCSQQNPQEKIPSWLLLQITPHNWVISLFSSAGSTSSKTSATSGQHAITQKQELSDSHSSFPMISPRTLEKFSTHFYKIYHKVGQSFFITDLSWVEQRTREFSPTAVPHATSRWRQRTRKPVWSLKSCQSESSVSSHQLCLQGKS